jgi:acetyl esterase/lipase
MMSKAEEIRKTFGEIDTKRDAGLTSPTDVMRYDNIRYGLREDQLCDLYTPRDKGPYPLIIHVHGGGWVYGDKERYQFYCMHLSQYGFAVCNFNYALAPEFKFPTQLTDIQQVAQLISDKMSYYKIDPKRIYMMGDSAGAHLCALYIDALYNKDFQKKFPFIKKLFDIQAIALNCGVYDPSVDELIHEVIEETTDPQDVNVIAHLSSKQPPVFVMSCQDDFLSEQPLKLMKGFYEHHIPFEYHFYTDDEKEMLHCYFLNVRDARGEEVNRDLKHFFDKHQG